MRIKSHIVCSFSKKLVSELERKSIKYKMEMHPYAGTPFLVFDAVDFQDRSILPIDAYVLDIPLYSKKEIDDAVWLTCRCTNAKVTLSNEEQSIYSSEPYDNGTKANHRFLSGEPFYVKRAPKHRDTQGFFSSYSLSEYHLFCSERAKQVLLLAFPTIEVSFEPILSSDKKAQIEDLYYLNVKHFCPHDTIDFSEVEKICCPVCNKESFIEPLQLTMKGFNQDSSLGMIRTPEVFCRGGNLTYSILIVSQQWRRIIIENKLERGLCFEPINLKS